MGEAMLRTAYSQILNSSRDFSTALCDAEGRLVAQAEHVPIHVGALPWASQSVSEFFGGRIQPGDVYLLNDPYHGSNHLPDLTVLRARLRGRPAGVLVDQPRAPERHRRRDPRRLQPGATEIWQEGIRITPLKLYERGELRDDVLQMIATNVRHPRDFRGDLAAMIGSARVGERRLLAARRRVRLDTTLAAVGDDPRRRRAADARVHRAPGRTASTAARQFLDDDGHGARDIHIRATVTKRGQRPHGRPHRLAPAGDRLHQLLLPEHALGRRSMALAYLIDPAHAEERRHVPAAHGEAKQGTVVWPNPPAPVTLCTNHCAQEIVEAIIKALAPALPRARHGGLGPALPHRDPGRDPRNERPFIWHLFQARAGRRRLVGGRRLGDRPASGRRPAASSSAASRWPRCASRSSSGATSSARTRAATAATAAAPGGELELRMRDRPSRRGAIPPATACAIGACGMLGGEDGLPHRYRLQSRGRHDRAC